MLVGWSDCLMIPPMVFTKVCGLLVGKSDCLMIPPMVFTTRGVWSAGRLVGWSNVMMI